MHVELEHEEADWIDFPGVRHTLERWGLLAPGSTRSEVVEKGLRVSKFIAAAKEPVEATIHYLNHRDADLVVLATHQREGVSRWTHRAVAEPIARRAKTMTLFVPHGQNGFISLADGAVSLQRIVIPVDSTPHPQAAAWVAAQLVQTLEVSDAILTLVYVGAEGDMPSVQQVDHPEVTWERVVRKRPVVEQILEVGNACEADLIVMATAGRHGFLDALRGSTSEQIVRRATCPVLAIPIA